MLLVPTTQPEDIASYANRVANAWKIGRRDVGDGILVIVAKDDRRVRIEVAKTLEGAVPDLAAKMIIDEAITPRFRQGDFAGGLQAGGRPADRAHQRRGAARAGSAGGRAPADGFNWFDLAIFLFFAVPIAGAVLRGIFGRKLGSLLTGGGVGGLAMLLTSSLVVAVVAGVRRAGCSRCCPAWPRCGGRRRGGGGPVIFPGGGWGGGGGGGWRRRRRLRLRRRWRFRRRRRLGRMVMLRKFAAHPAAPLARRVGHAQGHSGRNWSSAWPRAWPPASAGTPARSASTSKPGCP